MEKIEYTPDFQIELINSCVETINNEALKRDLIRSSDAIIASNSIYAELARYGKLFEVDPSNRDGIYINKKNMIRMYTEKLAKRHTKTRKYYDRIKLFAKNGRCPYCGIKKVNTLDHFLAKSIYDAFAITITNLVPCCADCNKRKKEKKYTAIEEMYLHPYFEDIHNFDWLGLFIEETYPIGFVYKINVNCGLNEKMLKRITNQFKTLNLAEEYAFRASEELSEIEHYLKELKNNYGIHNAKCFLNSIAISSTSNTSIKWKKILFQVLANSSWFLTTYL